MSIILKGRNIEGSPECQVARRLALACLFPSGVFAIQLQEFAPGGATVH
jgi:hypothetical protein